MKANIRSGDLFVRLGGDEFCVVLLNCSQEIMQEKFKNVYEAFRQEVPVIIRRASVMVS